MEHAVWEEVIKLLSEPSFASSLIKEAGEVHSSQLYVTKADKLRSKLQGIEEQIEALAEHLAQVPKGISPAPIFAQMQRLEGLKQEALMELNQVARDGASTDIPATLRDYQSFLKLIRTMLSETGSAELRSKIVQKLVEKVEVLPHAFRLYFHVGKSRIIPRDWEAGSKDPVLSSQNTTRDEPYGSSPDFSIFSNLGGSKRLTNGRADWI